MRYAQRHKLFIVSVTADNISRTEETGSFHLEIMCIT